MVEVSDEPVDRQSSAGGGGTGAGRMFLWGVLAAVLLAVSYAAWFGPGWVAGNEREPPPEIAVVPPFQLTERNGQAVRLDDLAGAPWVADFIFTRCAMSCPRMTAAMRRLETSLPVGSSARLVSVSVDPGYDTPEVLAEYASSYGITDERWLFLTGTREQILKLVTEGFLLGLDDSEHASEMSPAEPILHSDRFVLVDGKGVIRGFYDPFDPAGFQNLLLDLTAVDRSVAR